VNWGVFAVAAVACVALDESLIDALALDASSRMRPSAVAVLAASVILLAPRPAALWACLILGLMLDLTTPLVGADGGVLFVVGPRALGHAAAAGLLLRLRPALPRQRVVSIAAIAPLLFLCSDAVAIAVNLIRALHPGPSPAWFAGGVAAEAGRRVLVAAYTGLLGLPLGWLLLRAAPWCGLVAASERSPGLR
jgi:hypothetical protein